MEEIRKLSTREIYNNNQGRSVPAGFNQIKIILHNIRSMYNVGSVFRSCDAFGVSDLILTGYTPHPPRAEIAKTALGADNTVPWRFFPSFGTIYEELKLDDYEFIGLEQTTNSTSLVDFKIHSNHLICLVMGNEVTGIDNEIIPFIDHFLEIPQYGQKHSLNVSVSAGIALFSLLERFIHQ